MKRELQRIAIAKECGWKISPQKNEAGFDLVWLSRPDGYAFPHPIASENLDRFIPDYLTDLNAMHEAEKILSDRQDLQCQRYLENIKLVRRNQTGIGVSPFGVCHATASQRAEAFLRTVGKWMNDEKSGQCHYCGVAITEGNYQLRQVRTVNELGDYEPCCDDCSKATHREHD